MITCFDCLILTFSSIQALTKKEHKNGACGSPESPDAEGDYQLTPRTEAKFSKIDEEFQMLMQRNQQQQQQQQLNGGQRLGLPPGVSLLN